MATQKKVKKTVSKKASSKKAPAKKAAKKVAAKKGARPPGAGPASLAILGAGAKVPAFKLPDQDGATLDSKSLAGSPYVLYFYPKDDTPGCTREACGFRDDIGKFQGLGVRIIGVSPDKSESHQKFKAKYGLNFTLLSDTDKTLSAAMGVWAKKQNYGREYMGIVRSTFLVGPDGKIQASWRNVKVDGHVAAVLAAAG